MRARSTTPRWVDLIPLVVLGGAFGVMAAIHPSTVRELDGRVEEAPMHDRAERVEHHLVVHDHPA